MNFFEQELRKLFEDGSAFDNPTFTGRVCYGDLDPNLRARAEFVTTGHANHFDALKITLLNRTTGPIDGALLRFSDLLGTRSPNGMLKNMVPHIWIIDGKAEWYAYQPNAADYAVLRGEAIAYTNVFRSREHALTHDKLDDKLVDAAKRTGR